jgi:hypothetical protein
MVFCNDKLCSLVNDYHGVLENAVSTFSVIRGFTVQVSLTYRKNVGRLYFVYKSRSTREVISVVWMMLLVSLFHTRDLGCRTSQNFYSEYDLLIVLKKCSSSNSAKIGHIMKTFCYITEVLLGFSVFTYYF